jgi:beta-lactamase superfamily II metal-dependent hydrolase
MVTATVRMYAVGFGDCFLVTIDESGERPWRMLVDCGVHGLGRSEHPLDVIVGDIVKTVTDAEGTPRIDVVVATHRHQDHVSGFADAQWARVEVGQVWLPWSEDPADTTARTLTTRINDLARGLHLRLAADAPEASALALNSLANERAMRTLQSGFAGTPVRRYLSAEAPTPLDTVGLGAGRIHLLGPSKSRDAIKAMEPPRAEQWLRMAADLDAADGTAESPFPPEYGIPDVASFNARYPHLTVDPTVLKGIASRSEDALLAASWLDRALNNTSIVFVLELEGRCILFSGDAQWGVWRTILENSEARALLARTDLYKVSHHGSHNGTPKELVHDVLPAEVTSLISVRPMKRWSAIPKDNLLEALTTGERRVLRTDEPDAMPPAVRHDPNGLWSEIDLAPATSLA